MASRQIVSYDDLYDADEAENTTQPEQQRPHSASSHTSIEEESLCAGDIIAQPGAWDDSDLVRAWDSTVEEYRKQHASMLGDSSFRATMHETESKVGQWSAVTESLDIAAESSSKKRRRGVGTKLNNTDPEYEDYANALPAYPEAPLSEEDALSKLNMAWYHAGFYAGYYQAYRSGVGSKSAEEANVGADAEADAIMDQEEAI